jgi:hypothetical protein
MPELALTTIGRLLHHFLLLGEIDNSEIAAVHQLLGERIVNGSTEPPEGN